MAPSVEFSDYTTDTEDENSSPPSTLLPPTRDIPRRVGNSILLAEREIDIPPYIRVAKWQSEKSRLKVVWADVPSLTRRFWTTVVTEAFDSSGVPHSKEHLTFTASRHYPYFGILDAISHRMLLDKPSSSWLEHFERVPYFPPVQVAYMPRPRDLLAPVGNGPAQKAVIYTIPSSESTYLFARSRSPDWTHKDHPALSVAATGGLAYGAMLQDNVGAGCITFVVYKSPDAFAALVAVHFQRTDQRASFIDTATVNRPPRMAQLLLSQIKDVTIDDATRVIRTWFAPLFDAKTSIIGASTTEGNREELASNLQKMGYDVEQRHF
ncbi:hypothetical protein JCM21900_000776 [Sporobolomyces salmonicolor]